MARYYLEDTLVIMNGSEFILDNQPDGMGDIFVDIGDTSAKGFDIIAMLKAGRKKLNGLGGAMLCEDISLEELRNVIEEFSNG